MVAPGIALSVNHVVEEHVTDVRRGRLGQRGCPRLVNNS